MPATSERVLVGLSGGADSAAAVLLLQQQGYTVIGGVLDLSPAHAGAVTAAREAADALGISLEILRAHDRFEQRVIAPFCASYAAGRTPNPCIVCNPTVKFRLLCEAADRLDCACIATGHYARIARAGDRFCVRRAVCAPRDQSYMLYRLTQRQLSRLLLPLGDAPDKQTVRETGRRAGLHAADAPDSQEICFIPDGDYAAYIERRNGPCPPGDFIGPDGAVCGRHQGVLRYTVGQRKGLGLALGRPVYIRRIDAAANRVYLADDDGAWFSTVRLDSVCWQLPPAGGAPFAAQVKIRSAAPPAEALVTPTGPDTAELAFALPVRAPAPGQSAVLYRDELVLGGGFIASAQV